MDKKGNDRRAAQQPETTVGLASEIPMLSCYTRGSHTSWLAIHFSKMAVSVIYRWPLYAREEPLFELTIFWLIEGPQVGTRLYDLCMI